MTEPQTDGAVAASDAATAPVTEAVVILGDN